METSQSEEYSGGMPATSRAIPSPITMGVVGIGAVGLAIIGLANVAPQFLASIASIAIGMALAFEGGMISARYATLVSEGLKTDEFIRVGGVSALFLAGASGIALGILALVGVHPVVLIPVSAVVFGSALILDSGTNERLSVLEARHHAKKESALGVDVIREAAQSSVGMQVMAGATAFILGILGLIHIVPIVLALVAFLSIGAVNLLSSPLITSRISNLVQGR